MTFHIITLFPRAFDSYLGESILKRAIEGKKIAVKFYNPRDFTADKHKRIDRAPYGGGPGMVIQAEPVLKAVEAALRKIIRARRNYLLIRANKQIVSAVGKLNAEHDLSARTLAQAGALNAKIIWLTPSGKQFTNAAGIKLARCTDLIIICGRYEGIDARVTRAARAMGVKVENVSVGPFVLTGGELPAMLMIDVISRQVPGVLGDPESREEVRAASPEVYTRPEAFTYRGKSYRVPKILLTGHHAKIDEWRRRRRQ